MVALGGAALWGMRQHGLQAGMTFAAPAIEYQPPSADKGQQASQQRVLAALERTGMHAQVPAEKFDRNPFSTGIKKTVATAGMPPTRATTIRARVKRRSRSRSSRSVLRCCRCRA